jgi:hypothetical protein
MIYEGSPSKHLRGIASVIIEQLRANHRCLYLNSPTMVAGIRSYLAAAGLDVAHEVSKGSLVLTSEQGHLINGRFDVDKMLGMLEDSVRQALKDGYEGLWATGDMAWEFGNGASFGELLMYEYGLEELFRKLPALSGICQYHRDNLPDQAVLEGLGIHPALYINETLSRLNPYYAPNASPARVPPDASISLEEMLNRLVT